MAVPAVAAVPLADAGIKYAAEISKSLVATVSDALRSPILATETTVSKVTRRGTKTTTSRAALPAWVAVAGGLMALWWLAPQRSGSSSSSSFTLPGGFDPFWWRKLL